MRVAAVGAACVLAGIAIGAGAIVLIGDDDVAAPAVLPSDVGAADDEQLVRGGHVIVFLAEGVTDGERQAIEAEIEATDGVVDYEFWNAEASRAEARRLFRDDAEMLEKIDDGVHIPESFRLQLRDPSRPNATIVASQMDALPGVLQVTITNSVPRAGA